MLLTLTLQLVHCLQRCFCLYSDGVYLVRAIIQNLLYLSSFFFFYCFGFRESVHSWDFLYWICISCILYLEDIAKSCNNSLLNCFYIKNSFFWPLSISNIIPCLDTENKNKALCKMAICEDYVHFLSSPQWLR